MSGAYSVPYTKHLSCVASLVPLKTGGIPCEILRNDYCPPVTGGRCREGQAHLDGRTCLAGIWVPAAWLPMECLSTTLPLQGAGAAYKGTNAIHWALSSWPDLTLITSQRSHLQMPSLWGVGLTQQFGGHSLVHSRDCIGRSFDPGENSGV